MNIEYEAETGRPRAFTYTPSELTAEHGYRETVTHEFFMDAAERVDIPVHDARFNLLGVRAAASNVLAPASLLLSAHTPRPEDDILADPPRIRYERLVLPGEARHILKYSDAYTPEDAADLVHGQEPFQEQVSIHFDDHGIDIATGISMDAVDWRERLPDALYSRINDEYKEESGETEAEHRLTVSNPVDHSVTWEDTFPDTDTALEHAEAELASYLTDRNY